MAAIALASLQSSESKPHSPHRSTLTFPILPYGLGLSHLPVSVMSRIRPSLCGAEGGAIFETHSSSGRRVRALRGFGPLSALVSLAMAATMTAACASSRQTSTSSAPRSTPTEVWANMANHLNIDPDVVSCPTTGLCLFTGSTPGPTPGRNEQAVAASTGPFTPGARVTGRITMAFPGVNTPLYVSCPSATLCVLSTPSALYATRAPLSGPWILQRPSQSDEGFQGISCPSPTFCAAATGHGVVVSTSPMGGPSAWLATDLSEAGGGIGTISCPTSHECVAGGSGIGGDCLGGLILTSADPAGGASTWIGGPTTHSNLAQHCGQYGIDGLSCPTTSFCVAHVVAGDPLVATDPTGGISAWNSVPSSWAIQGATWCDAKGTCRVSGSGTFQSAPGAPGPRVAGLPQFLVSCPSVSLCVSVGGVGASPLKLKVGDAASPPDEGP